MQTKWFALKGHMVKGHMLAFAPRLCIIAKNSLVVNMFIFKVFVWAKFTCAGQKPVDSNSVILLGRRKRKDILKDNIKYKKGERSQSDCEIQGSSLAHSPSHGVKHVFFVLPDILCASGT